VSILSQFIPVNEDDKLGGIQFIIRNQNNAFEIVEMMPGQFTTMDQPLNRLDGTFACRFRHDGGDYIGTFRLQAL
jgi:hypothetical protein